MKIAHEILEQLGGAQFITVSGAKQLAATETGLIVKLPETHYGRACLKVEIEPSGKYTVELYTTERHTRKNITFAHVESIEADELQGTVEDIAGLSLTPCRRRYWHHI